MHLPILAPGKSEYFTACFGTEEPLQTCGPELKTKLHDPFEPFSTSYHVLVVNRVSEVTFINYFTSKSQISTTFLLFYYPNFERRISPSFDGKYILYVIPPILRVKIFPYFYFPNLDSKNFFYFIPM